MTGRTEAPGTNISDGDRFDAIFGRQRVSAHVFFTGRLCGIVDFTGQSAPGHLHLLRQGTVAVTTPDGQTLMVEAPAALLFARPSQHRLTGDDAGGDLVCAEIDLGGPANPFYGGLPPFLWLPLGKDTAGHLGEVLTMLFTEAEETQSGRQAVMDRLAEIALIHLLRHAMDRQPDKAGLLAGLAHPQVGRALTAMHERPGADWTLERLAEEAGISRSGFAELFHRLVGQAPGHYLAAWRLALAREALAAGRPVKIVAREIGYRSPAALSRAFARHFGTPARTFKKS